MRISRLGLKVGMAGPLEEAPQLAQKVSLRVSGKPGIGIFLMGDAEFSRRVAAGTFGVEIEDLRSGLISDGMGEFLNILAGNAVSILERGGVLADVEPPEYRARPSDGCLFEVVTTEGSAGLVLAEA